MEVVLNGPVDYSYLTCDATAVWFHYTDAEFSVGQFKISEDELVGVYRVHTLNIRGGDMVSCQGVEGESCYRQRVRLLSRVYRYV